MIKSLKVLALAGVAVFGVRAGALACDGHEGPGKSLSRLDGNGDGKVTQAEMLAGWSARFDAMDTNKDGTVNDEERTAALAAHMKEKLNALDTNKNGSIEKNEARGPLAEFFAAIDTDKNGSLSTAELDAHHKQHGPGHGKGHEGPGHGKGHGPHGGHGPDDGALPATKAELSARVAEAFKRLDRNGDGELSGAELEMGRGHGHGHEQHPQR